MSFTGTMNTVLPSNGGNSAHVTSHYGSDRGSGPHGGVDFNYNGGQSGVNLQHPRVNSPVDGTVVDAGGRYGWVVIRDADGNTHEILQMDSQTVKKGDTVHAGDQIGTMGGTGPKGPKDY